MKKADLFPRTKGRKSVGSKKDQPPEKDKKQIAKDKKTVGFVRRALKSQPYGQKKQWEFDPVVGSQTAETSKRRHREGNERGGFSTDGKD